MPKVKSNEVKTTWPRSGSVQPSEIVNQQNVQGRNPNADDPAARFDGVHSSGSASAPLRDGPRATLTFDGSWGEQQSGPLKAGGQLVVRFDPARVQIRHTHNGFPAWGVNAFVKFHPGEQLVERPAVEFESYMGRPTSNAKPADIVLDIPAGTTKVEVWFKNWTGADHPEERWDSDWGKNYSFAVE